MKLIKRVIVDIRGPNQSDSEIDQGVNKELMELQTNNEGKRNGIEVLDVGEITKDSGIIVYNILYDDPSLGK